MSDVASTASASNVLGNFDISTKTPSTQKSNDLGQDAFLQLMIAQMKNQDPLSPQNNSEFVAQLAQFSSVQGLQKLNDNFTNFSSSFMSNQALQASSLVGRSVSVDGNSSVLSQSGIVSGVVSVPASAPDLKINIYDSTGALAATVPVGSVESGDTNFRWDGQNMEINGKLIDWNAGSNPAQPGTYTFEALATQNGKVQQLSTSMSANVNSVTVGTDGKVVLNLAGVGPTDMSKVKQFN